MSEPSGSVSRLPVSASRGTVTRPKPSLGITPRLSSKGTPMSARPGRASDLYPTLRKNVLAGMSICARFPLERYFGVTFALAVKGSVGSSSLREKRTWERRWGNLGDH